jgi:hypothetical protein
MTDTMTFLPGTLCISLNTVGKFYLCWFFFGLLWISLNETEFREFKELEYMISWPEWYLNQHATSQQHMPRQPTVHEGVQDKAQTREAFSSKDLLQKGLVSYKTYIEIR